MVERFDKGNVDNVKAKTVLIENPNILSLNEQVGSIEGLNFNSLSTKVGVVHDSVGFRAGLRSLDQITSIKFKTGKQAL